MARPALISDALAIAELSGELGYPVGVGEMKERLDVVLASNDHGIFVSETDDRVSGWIHAVAMPGIEYPLRVEIAGLVVDAACRRQGIGRRLVAAVERWAAGRKIGTVTVRSNATRAESHPFYESLGYVKVKTSIAYRKSLPG